MKKTKSVITGVLAACMMFATTSVAMAKEVTYTNRYGREIVFGSNEFNVKYNGDTVKFPDAQPYVDANNRTLVPVRFVSETMGADVKWNADTRTAVIAKGDTTVKVTIGNKSLAVAKNGTESAVAMDTEAVLKDGRTFVPVRYVAEALGAWVGYSDLFNTAQIYADKLTPAEINRLQAYHDMTWDEYCASAGGGTLTQESWLDDNPHYNYFAGTGAYGFANANEWMQREGCSSFKSLTFKGVETGATWKYGANPEIEFAELMLNEAIAQVEKSFNKDGLVEADFRADLSTTFRSRHCSGITANVRGVLTIKIPENATSADLSAISAKYGISNVRAGETDSADFEVVMRTAPQSGFVVATSLAQCK